jgi:hypothetical protein
LARRFVELFEGGPDGIRGNWVEAQRAAGYKKLRSHDDPTLWNLIMEYRKRFQAAPPEAVDEELEALSQALVEVADVDDWSVLAERARPLLAKIAAGQIKASNAQISALKMILQHAPKEAGDGRPLGVVVLPALGSGADMQMCPRCRYELEEALQRGELEEFVDS